MKVLGFFFVMFLFVCCSVDSNELKESAVVIQLDRLASNMEIGKMVEKYKSIPQVKSVEFRQSENTIKVVFHSTLALKNDIEKEFNTISKDYISSNEIIKTFRIKSKKSRNISSSKKQENYFPTRVSFPNIFKLFITR